LYQDALSAKHKIGFLTVKGNTANLCLPLITLYAEMYGGSELELQAFLR
jgi:hypothetical protein